MRLTVVDAFTDRAFAGNPAAVAVLDAFPADDRMAEIAREMNLSETAFVVARGGDEYDLRWFTPTTEVDLCGHATLAAAHVLGRGALFHTRSGRLDCALVDGWVVMDFPRLEPVEAELPLRPGGIPSPRWTGTGGDDWLVEIDSAAELAELRPDLAQVAALGRRGLVVTARADEGAEHDFVSRVFGPNVGIAEDPVTGSAHCVLGPYWAARLGRESLVGYQASARGGTVRVRLAGARVEIAGRAVTTSEVTLVV